jgi:cob(I)alamin adenosyltransferase
MALKIYTKQGDDGSTGLIGAGRRSKDALRIEAYGTVDELNACLGLARSSGLSLAHDALVARLQDELFALGSALAAPDSEGKFFNAITSKHVKNLEDDIDLLESGLPALTQFVLPGGCAAASGLHLARTVCRRAERRVVSLMREPGEAVSHQNLIYLNRLSDLLFVLSRAVNQSEGVADVPWRGLRDQI